MESALPCQGVDNGRLCLPPEPERPLDSDCCGGGCEPCVLDIYEEELHMWREECERIKEGRPSQQEQEACPGELEAARLCSNKYTKYLITSVSPEATDIVRIRCQLPRGLSLGLSMGQHIIIRFLGASDVSTTRQYTPTSALSATGYFEMMIKIYPEGRASQIVKQWKVEDHVEARGPAGHLSYKPNKYAQVLMLCAGTGVAPMCQVTQAILEDQTDDTVLRLVYAARDYSCLMARQEIAEWRRYWNFSCCFLLSQEPEKTNWRYKHGEEVKKGRIDAELIKSELGSRPLDRVLVLVCGTRAFDSDIIAGLEAIGVPESNIHKF